MVNLAAIAQTDPLFSNYMINRTFKNPGFVGAEKTINAVFNNRTMFAGLGDGKPVTSVFGIDAPVNLFGANTGVGVLIMSNKFGFFENVYVNASFSYHHSLQNGKLGGGVSVGAVNTILETGSWEIPNDEEYFGSIDGDDLIPSGGEYNQTVLGVNAGLYYETPEYYVGLSGTNLNRANWISTSQENKDYTVGYFPAHFYLTGTYNIELPNPLFDLHPSMMLRTDLASYSLDLNGTFYYDNKYWFGGGVRTSFRSIDAFTFLGGVKLMNGLNIGYAMDLNLGMILVAPTSHEVFVTYSFNLDTKRDQKYKSVRFL